MSDEHNQEREAMIRKAICRQRRKDPDDWFPATARYRRTSLALRSSVSRPDIPSLQRGEINRLCHEADVPAQSGELLALSGAQQFVDDLKKQITERK
jgi:hypothetical protein